MRQPPRSDWPLMWRFTRSGGHRQGCTASKGAKRAFCGELAHPPCPKRGHVHIARRSGHGYIWQGAASHAGFGCAVGDPLLRGRAAMTASDVLVEGNGAAGEAPFIAPTSADEVRAYVRNNGIQFLFAQFVDMHGK